MTKSEVDHLEDGYRWRKYGQKAVKNSPFPRFDLFLIWLDMREPMTIYACLACAQTQLMLKSYPKRTKKRDVKLASSIKVQLFFLSDPCCFSPSKQDKMVPMSTHKTFVCGVLFGHFLHCALNNAPK